VRRGRNHGQRLLRGRRAHAHRWNNRRKLRRRGQRGSRLRETIVAVLVAAGLGFGEGPVAANNRHSPEFNGGETMIRLTVLYPAKDGETFNYDYYFNDHHKLVVSRWKPEGMVSCEFDKGVSDPAGGKAPYLAIAYLKFDSVDVLQKALAKHGAEIMGDVPNYTKIEPIMQVNEVMAS
jgi:uncharacterized protein (TIGR02118 family)